MALDSESVIVMSGTGAIYEHMTTTVCSILTVKMNYGIYEWLNVCRGIRPGAEEVYRIY